MNHNLLIISTIIILLVIIVLILVFPKIQSKKESYGCEFWESCFWSSAYDLIEGIGKNVLAIGKIVPKLLTGDFDNLGDALSNIKDIYRVIQEVKDPKTKEERLLKERAELFLKKAMEEVNKANEKLEIFKDKMIDIQEEFNPERKVALQNKIFTNLAISTYLKDRKMDIFRQDLPEVIRFLSKENTVLDILMDKLSVYIPFLNFITQDTNWTRVKTDFENRMNAPSFNFINKKNWYWGDKNNIAEISDINQDGSFVIQIENIIDNFETDAPGVILEDGTIMIKSPIGVFKSQGVNRNNVIMFKSPQGLDVMVFPKI